MSKIVKLLFICCLLIVSYGRVSSSTAQSMDLPYIYYYSSTDNAFLIERVDGEEQEILLDLQNIADSKDTIAGPGWSPSHTWFAWTVYSRPGKANGYVLNRHTKEVISLVESHEHDIAVDLEWSPTRDTLLVSNIYSQQTTTEITRFLWLPEADYQVVLPGNESSNVGWSEDGQHVYSVAKDNHEVSIIDTDGKTTVFEALFDRCWSFWMFTGQHLNFKSGSNELALVTDLDAMSIVHYPLPEPIIRYIDWSPDGEYALVYLSTDCYTEVSLWWLSIPDNQLTLIDEDVVYPFDWKFTQFSKSSISLTSWAKSTRYAYFLNTEHQLSILEIPTLNVQPNIVDFQNHYFVEWHENNLFIFDEQDLLDDSDSTISKFNPENKSSVVIEPGVNGAQHNLNISPDGEYIGYTVRSIQAGTTILGEYRLRNLNTGEFTDLVMTPEEWGGVFWGMWHPDNDWLFLTSLLPPLSDYLFLNVVNVDGTIQRELPARCTFTGACFGWMP